MNEEKGKEMKNQDFSCFAFGREFDCQLHFCVVVMDGRADEGLCHNQSSHFVLLRTPNPNLKLVIL